ncbi:class F sortase [Amycolatopsis sp. FDAARGOS 1241]|uniref:class F sortase n=1 Tax=Amycolatopsis sp. FDAARGOS 1241 TaxID=2778070 RepID=UPI00195222E0|nr:class F sortase [Amycolatopsis sp. FDAARGOS 1241]QRP47166.1 class F sortase [Amycolatopsis sp. FDAARGOS 1241]
MASKSRLLTGFVLGAASVLGVELAAVVISAPPTAVVAGTAQPAAAALGVVPSPSPTPASSAPPPVSTAPSSTPTASPPAAPVEHKQPGPQKPGTIRLPGGGTAAMVRQGLGPGNTLPVPSDIGQAAWWGAALDAVSGASVFAGHVNWKGATGPFAELWNERIGGEVTIVDSAGKTSKYRVSQLVTVHKDDLPGRADDLFGQAGPHRVVLVTCGGRWIGGTDGYEENRVVIADPV